MSSISFSLIRPHKTLANFTSGRCICTANNAYSIWISLGQLDVDSIKENDLELTASYWRRALNMTLFSTMNSSLSLDGNLLSAIISIADISIKLSKRLQNSNFPNYEPVLTALGLSYDIFNDTEPPEHYPYRDIPTCERELPLIYLILNQFSSYIRIQNVLQYCLIFFSQIYEISPESEVFQYINPQGSLSSQIETLTAYRILQFTDLNSLMENASKLPKIENPVLFLCLMYLIERTHNVQIRTPLNSDSFYERFILFIIEHGLTEISLCLPIFALTTGKKIDVPVPLCTSSTNYSLIIGCMLLRNLFNDFDVKSIFEMCKHPYSYLFLAFSQNSKTEIFSTFFADVKQMDLNSEWKEALQLIENESYACFDTFEVLIEKSLNGDVSAARNLFGFPPSKVIPSLTPDKSIYHKLLSILLSDPMDLPDPLVIDETTPAKLFKSMQFKRGLHLKNILNSIQKQLNDLILETFKDKLIVHMVRLGFVPDGYVVQNIPLPKLEKDFITDFTENKFGAFMYVIYLIYLVQQDLSKIDFEQAADFVLISCFGSEFQTTMTSIFPLNFSDVINKRQQYHLEEIFKEKSRRKESLELLKNCLVNINNAALSSVAKTFLDDTDFNSFISMFNISPQPVAMVVSQIDHESRLKIFQQLLELDNSSQMIIYFIDSMLMDMDIQAKDNLFFFLGENSLKYPAIILDIFSSIAHEPTNLLSFLKAIPDFSGNIQQEFFILLRKILQNLPQYMYKQEVQHREITKLPTEWENPGTETKENENITQEIPKKHKTIDIWEPYDEFGVCNLTAMHDSAMFSCYTCGIVEDNRICIHCALTCHKGHDITYSMRASRPCCCSICKNKQSSQNQSPVSSKPKEDTKKEQQTFPEASAELLVKIYNSIINSTIIKNEGPIATKRLNGDIHDIELNLQLPTKVVNSHFKLTTVPHSPQLIDMSQIITIISEKGNLTHFVRRTQSSPIIATAIAGSSMDILVVCDGENLVSYRFSTMTLLSSFNTSYVGLQIAVCDLDPSVIAVASLHHVLVVNVNEDGVFSITQEIQLMLDSIGPHIFVNSVFWIPLTALQLGVVCNAFVKIYDVPIDCFSPIACFKIDEPLFFTSAFFAEYNEESYGVFGSSNGRIYLQKSNVQSVDGPIPLTLASNIKNVGEQPMISYSSVANLVFISSPQSNLQICRLEELFAQEPKTLVVQTTALTNNALSFISLHPTIDSIFFLGNPYTGIIYTLEFTDTSIEFSSFSKNAPTGNMPLFDHQIFTYSAAQLRAISHKGKMMMLASADAPDQTDDEEKEESDDEEVIEDDDPFDVPASFWSQSTISTNGIEVSAPKAQSDARCLLSGTRFVFSNIIPKKILEISSNDPNQLIVGFRVYTCNYSYNHRPPYIKLLGRKYVVTSQRSFCIPLRPSEIRPKRKYRIEFGSLEGNDITCDALDVFVINREDLPEKYKIVDDSSYNWFKDGTSIFDFVDSKNEKTIDTIVELTSMISSAVTLSYKATEESLVRFIHYLYSKPEISFSARRLIMKGSKDKDRDVIIWAKEMKKMIENKEIDEKLWNLVWRDFTLLPRELKKDISTVIWNANSTYSSIYSVLSAFLTE